MYLIIHISHSATIIKGDLKARDPEKTMP